EQLTVDQVAQAVDRQQMHFLDACSGACRHTDFHIGGQQQGGHRAAVASGQGNHQHLAVVGGLNSLHHVRGVAAGGDRQQHVTGLSQGADLLGEYLLVAVVVGNRGDGGAVGGQGDGGQAGA